MVGGPAWLARVVSPFCPLLGTIPGEHRGVEVKRIVIQMEVVKEPLVQQGKHPLVYSLVKLLKVTLESTVAGHTPSFKYIAYGTIMPGYLQMLKAVGSTPYAH